MFSVVIPVFNHERYLTQCILSAAANSLVSEVLLLDDGSSDGSYELVRRLSGGALGKVRDVTPRARRNRGAHVALNDLVDQAKCEWVAVLNSDDNFIANRFELAARRLRHESCDLLFGDLCVIDGGGHQLGRKRGAHDPQLPFPRSFDVERMAAAGNWLDLLSHQNLVATTSNMVFRKSLFYAVGGFREYRYIHDWDFMLRACMLGRAVYVPHPFTAYRVHAANTIKESSRRVDAEVQNMFRDVASDFPELARRKLFQAGLAENPYLHPAPPPPLSVVMPAGESKALYQAALGERIRGVEIRESGEAAPPGEFLYAPTDLLRVLHPVHIENVLLALAFLDLDFVVVSHSLAESPLRGAASLRDSTIFRASERAVFLDGQSPERPLNGRVARLLPGQFPVTLGDHLFEQFGMIPDNGRIGLYARPHDVIRETPLPNMLRCVQQAPKPVVFVLPAMFAVGGVERLVIDMMQQLRGDWDFVLITTERLTETQGSLHAEMEGIALGFYDLAELAPTELYLAMMARLRDVYRPSLVWICNGAPWQSANAAGIRKVFTGVAIVDQQAYDTEAGWIAKFDDPGIQSYDRFVAINVKIRETFIRRYGIPAEKIDMIYHSVNLDAIGPTARTAEERETYREKYGLPREGRVFGWVGRLTRQKRPLEFLEFARRAAEAGEDRHFVMIGNGELAGECDAFIARHKLTCVTPVRFTSTIGELFAVMSGMLGTSEYEGLPISMLEALAMGVPVFSTDVGDVGLVMEQFEAGAVTAAEWDLDRYCADFEAWMRELPEWQERARLAAPRVRERFANARVAREYDQCWRRAMAEAGENR